MSASFVCLTQSDIAVDFRGSVERRRPKDRELTSR
jgi:hypothetical protein